MNYEYLKCPHRIGMVLNTRIVQQVLYQEVADRLRAMIQARELEAGEWIDEVALTKTLGISRTPLREALKVLVAEGLRSEEHTSELQSLMRISYAVFCLKKKQKER